MSRRDGVIPIPLDRLGLGKRTDPSAVGLFWSSVDQLKREASVCELELMIEMLEALAKLRRLRNQVR